MTDGVGGVDKASSSDARGSWVQTQKNDNLALEITLQRRRSRRWRGVVGRSHCVWLQLNNLQGMKQFRDRTNSNNIFFSNYC